METAGELRLTIVGKLRSHQQIKNGLVLYILANGSHNTGKQYYNLHVSFVELTSLAKQVMYSQKVSEEKSTSTVSTELPFDFTDLIKKAEHAHHEYEFEIIAKGVAVKMSEEYLQSSEEIVSALEEYLDDSSEKPECFVPELSKSQCWEKKRGNAARLTELERWRKIVEDDIGSFNDKHGYRSRETDKKDTKPETLAVAPVSNNSSFYESTASINEVLSALPPPYYGTNEFQTVNSL